VILANSLTDEQIKKDLIGYGISGFRIKAGFIPPIMSLENKPPPSARITDWRKDIKFAPSYRIAWMEKYYGYDGYRMIIFSDGRK
jgi:hypothetical protein